MKKTLLSIFSFLLFCSVISGQTFMDDFESYNVGDYLGQSSQDWTTWSGNVGTNEDVRITDENALSGSNSIKFASLSNGGGPQDVVLFYGGQKLTTGFLNTKMSMLVETGAYFNYQAEVQIGQTWAMNAFFESNGIGRITGSGNQAILQFSYPVGEWFEFEMDINFDANKWQLKVNGVCVGSFASDDNSIASLDLFPLQGHSFFIDDISYEYSTEAPEFTEDVRAGLRSSLDNGIAGNTVALTGSITNNGSNAVNSFSVMADLNGEMVPLSFDGLDLQKGDVYEFIIDETFVMPVGQTSLSMEVTSVNDGAFVDEDICNDIGSVILNGVEPAEYKKVVVEEATGTWCGWCPRGTVWMDRMQNRYPGQFIGIAVHNDDPMADAAYDSGLGAGSWPNAVVNRGVWMDPSSIESPVLQEATVPSNAMLVHGALWDENTRELSISLDVTAFEALSTDHKVNIALTEDGVTGTSSGYGQRNYYSGSQDLIDDNGVNWRDLPSTVPAADMVYDHVARAILAAFDGLPNSFSEELAVDDTKVFNFNYTVPADFDAENMHIISMVIDPDGTINTGESTTIAEAVANGFNMVLSAPSIELDNATNVYPNPMNEYATVDINLVETTDVQISIFDLAGKVSLQKSFNGKNGFFRTNLDTSVLPAGSYLMKISTDNFFTTKRISIVR